MCGIPFIRGKGRCRLKLSSLLGKNAKRGSTIGYTTPTRRHHRAYELMAAKNGGSDPVATSELNQNMYLVLCRESHARPRLDSIAFAHETAKGVVHVQLSARDPKWLAEQCWAALSCPSRRPLLRCDGSSDARFGDLLPHRYLKPGIVH